MLLRILRRCVCAVECTPLKRAIEATYAAVLPKAAKPFAFLVRCAARCFSTKGTLHLLFCY